MTNRLLNIAALAALLLAQSVLAQDNASDAGAVSDEIDALEPGVDTSAMDVDRQDDDADDEPEPPEEVVRSEAGGVVMDRMELGRTEITGNQELPKVLYIVPWQKGEHGALTGRPVNTLLDEVMAPVDREEFLRTNEYYRELHESDIE